MSDFESRLARLEEIAEQLRDGSIDLDRAAALFTEGMKLSRKLDAELRKMERKIEVVVNAVDEPDEKPVLELFPELADGAPRADGSV